MEDNAMKTLSASLGLLLAIATSPAFAATPAPAAQIQTVPANSLKSHVGETVAVEAAVSDVHRSGSGRVVFLDMGGAYPNNVFAAVIFKDDLAKFSGLDALSGKTVRITGAVKLYRNKTEIVLSDPAQIKVKDGA